MKEKRDEVCDKITRDIFHLWEVAWRAGYQTCQEDLAEDLKREIKIHK